MKTLVDKFSSEFKIFVLPECATTIVKAGVTIIPSEFTEVTHTRFTKGICQLQIDLEKFFEEEAKSQKKDVLILTDRGVLDNFAYCTPKVKQNVYDETGWDENFTCVDRYDLVIHLVTAAQGAEEFYTLENNEARTETPEVARFLDKRTHEEWMLHPKLTVIDNSLPGFQNKLDRVVNAVSSLVNNKPLANKMFKSLVNWKAEEVKLPEGKERQVSQERITFLNSKEEDKLYSVRRRQIGGSGFASFFYTERFLDLKEENHMELSNQIDVKDYFNHLKNKDESKTHVEREVSTFSMDCDKTVNIYRLEVYQFKNEKMKEKADNLKKKMFGESARLDGTLVYLRGFTDTGKFTEGLFKELIPDSKDVTNIREFFVAEIANSA